MLLSSCKLPWEPRRKDATYNSRTEGSVVGAQAQSLEQKLQAREGQKDKFHSFPQADK